MTTSALYTPDNRILELGQVTESDLRLLESLRGNIKRGQNILLCQHPGGDPEMFVWRLAHRLVLGQSTSRGAGTLVATRSTA
jgi:hypothetical protein